MLSLITTCVVLAAAPQTLSIAAPSFTSVDLEASRAEFYAERLAQALGEHQLRVVTAKEIQSLLGLERQRELLGCADASSSCTAELAGALGVDAMLLGTLAKIEGLYQLDAKIIESKDGRKVASYSARVESERALLEKIDEGAAVLARQLRAAKGRGGAEAAEVSGAEETRRHWAWIPLVAGGGLCAAASVYFYGQANSAQSQLQATEGISLGEAGRIRSDGNNAQTAAAALLGTGMAAIVGGIGVFFLTAEPSNTTVSASVGPSGLVVGGTFP